MKYERAWQNKKAYKLYKENWKLCHEIIDLRDGHRCRICNVSPDLQLDHVFSRECKILFFDPKNLGYLCAPHHQHKSLRRGQWVDMLVKEIARKRDPDWFAWALQESKKICGSFRTAGYQEQININLKEQRSERND